MLKEKQYHSTLFPIENISPIYIYIQPLQGYPMLPYPMATGTWSSRATKVVPKKAAKAESQALNGTWHGGFTVHRPNQDIYCILYIYIYGYI